MEKIREYLLFLKEHKNMAKTAAIICIVIAAAVFFGQKGENDNISVQLEDESFTSSAESVEEEEESVSEERQTEEQEIYVDISGQVEKPGVYIVSDGTRLYEVIEKAGGLKKNAEMDQINRAEIVTDGQKIVIPAKGETIAASGGAAASGLININTADSTALQEIPGVGPATAEKIIAYRTENGRFASKEDIKNVSGIGEKTYEKMKDKITV